MFYLKNTQRVFLLLLLFCSGLSLTQAATITVTNNNDGGSGSLRNAISSAVNGDQIVFASGITTVNLTSGEIAFGKSITINGGTSGVTINRQVGSFRLFNISSGSVTFTRINLTNGNSTDGNGGGAIAGTSSVTLTMTNCNITGNSANGGGAAVVVSGPTTFTNCNFSNNSTTNTVGHCILLYPPGTLNMNGCTVSNNTGNVGGAAVDIRGGGGGNTTVNLTNCTISGNNRAGLITPNFECTISIINVTITDNATGFENYTDKCTMKNSIVAGNNFDVADLGPAFTAGSTNNILGNDGNSGLINGVNGNQIGADPKLLALASNGGFTQTHALSPCSPAINAGTSSGAPSTDQRGNSRFGTVDIGSYELQSAPSTFTVNTTPTNPSCGGQNNGSISVTITGGGVSPFTYAWSGSGIGLNPRTGLAPGTYTVTVTDDAGCTGTRSTTLTTASGPTVTSTGTNVSCNGGNNGAINLNVSGGAAPYTYAWTGTGTGTNPRTGLTAGTYTVTVTDDGGCTATRSTTLTAPTAINISAAPTNVTCNGAGNGSINLTVTGGTGGYTYAWSGTGTGTDPRTNLGPGTYTVTVTDANMCTRTSSATITEPAVLVVTPSATNANCGSSTGSISLMVNGGTAPYTYAWTGTGSGTNPRTGLAAGTYTVTVTDNQGCTRTASATLTSVDNTPPTITCPPTQAVAASSNCTAMLLNYPSLANVSDNCGVPVVTQSPAGATTLSLGANTVTLTATDASNNSASCTFTVNVNDVTPPTLACPSNATVSASGSCTAVLINYTSAATATDNCTTNLVKTQSPASGSIIVLGPNIITLSTTDNAGNNRTCTMTVTVRDVSAPFITNCPANTTVNANANGNYTMPNVANGVGVSDNCGGVPTRAQNPTAGTVLTVGTTTVTISATDAAGNTASCSYSLTVNPGCTPPVITCPTNKTIAAGANCTATLPSYVSQATVTNGCGLNTVTQSPAVGTTLSQGAHVVTLTATDANGSSSTCTFSVTVADQTAPTVTCPANTTVAAETNCSGTLGAYSASATDNCTTSPTATQSPAAGTTFTGSQVVTFTATDAAGNSGTCSFTVSVNDQTAPTITCPANTTVAAGANCTATLASYTAAATASDNCTASPTKTQSPSAGTTITGSQVVTLTATDAAGNSATCSFTVTVADQTAPTVTCPANTTVNAGANCSGTLGTYSASTSDNCTANPTAVQSPAAGTTFTGSQVVTFEATDAAGNSAFCSFTVSVNDQTAPTITCPANTTVAAGANCSATLASYTAAATAMDNCTANPTKTQSPAAGTSFTGAQVVTLTATDAAGNTATCSFQVSVTDQTAPSITCPGNSFISGNQNCQATISNLTGVATVNDNCTVNPTVVQNPPVGTVFSGSQIITLTASDAVGNSSTCSFNLMIVDQTAPSITCPANTTVAAGANCAASLASYTAAATASDNCTLNPTKTQSPAAGTTFTGSQVVTLTATDAAGNTATCSFLVTVADQTAPSITCPANTTVAAGANCTATLANYAATVTATDNCSANPNEIQNPAAGTTFTGSQVVTLTATDAAGNTATCSFLVTVADQTAPSITCPANTTVAAGANCTATLANYAASVTATDNCSANPNETQSPAAGTTFTGSQVVTLTATDAAGNTATCSFLVTVADQTAPSITCPANTTVAAGANCSATLANYAANVTATDNCSANPNETQNPAAGTTFTGSQVVTLTATDAAGNSATCSFLVTVADQTAPSITCPANTTVAAGANCTATLANYAASVTATDNCSANPNETQSPAAGTAITGSQVVTLTATDAAGNTATCSFLVTVADQTAPSITCPANTTVAAGANCTATLANYAASVSATDNCSANPNETQSPAAGTTITGSQIVTLTATDAAGNSANCSFLVTVTDQTAPSITCPANTTVAASANCTATLANYAASVSATDNCSANPTETQSPSAGTTITGSQVVTLSATDAAGNSATCTFTVTVTDQTAPSITCPANTTVAAGANCTATLANYAASVTATDNCSANPTETQSPAAGTVFSGSQTVTLTATDAAGNTAICSFAVTIVDQTAPSISCPANATVAAGANCTATLANYAASVTATDNCSANPTETQSPAAGTTITGSQVVTLTATDAAGNTANCSFLVTVTDQTAPSITCPANTTVAAGANCTATLANYAASVSATDNCAANPNETQSPAAGTTISGTQLVTLTATDAAGNTANCSFSVTLVDQTAPGITCPANTTVAAGANCTATLANYAATVSATDNCDANPNETQSPAAGTTISGTQTVTLTATDAAGNSAICSFAVTVVDQTAPSITCPANTTVAVGGVNCNAILGNYAASVTATDNCTANPTETQSPVAGTTISGVQVVTLTATDAAGNTSTCSFNVTAIDQTAPTVTCKPLITTLGANGTVTITTADVFQSGSDNCSVVNQVSVTPSTLTCANIGLTTVVLTVSDNSGNTATCSATVKLSDNLAPTVVCKNFTTSLNGTGTATITPANVYQSGTDNCGTVAPISVTPATFNCSNLGNNVVTLTAIDGSGNQATCSAIVTVTDPIAPVALCKNAIVSIPNTGSASVTTMMINNGTTDNCSFTLAVSPATFTCAQLGLNTVVLTATDASGNTATCSATVTVRDLTGPVAICKNATIFLNSTGEATLNPSQVNNGSYDACGIADMTVSDALFNCSDIGTPIAVFLRVRDINGNLSTCTSYVTVRDNTAPTASCEDVQVTLGANGKVAVYGASLASGSTDNCGVWSYTPIAKVYTTANLGVNYLTITVKDWSGNAATCVSEVTVFPNDNLGGNGNGTQSVNDEEDLDSEIEMLESEIAEELTNLQPSGNLMESDNTKIEVSIYPNPTMHDAFVEFQLPNKSDYRVVLLDANGRLTYLSNGFGAEGYNRLVLPMSELPSGVYFMELRAGALVTRKQLIRQE